MHVFHPVLRSLMLAVTGALLAAGLAFADPEITVEYNAGVPQVRLDGAWPGSRYTVYRGSQQSGPFQPISTFETLCLSECYADDFDALPGLVYWFLFDLTLEDGRLVSFGPYPVTISAERVHRVRATVSPNPGAGATRVQLFLAGSPSAARVEAVAQLFDLQGRVVRTLHRGPLGRGLTRVDWDGRDQHGARLGHGVYFLRFSSPLGVSVTHVLRAN
jgi:hypothetical protein